MKHLLNTLYVTTQGSYLARQGETVVVRVNRETRLRMPVHGLDGIVCFGRVSCSPPLMGMCAERGITISFFNLRGRFWGRVQGPVAGNVLLRREQYRRAAVPDEAAEVARACVIGKIANCRAVILRSARDHPQAEGVEDLTAAAEHMAGILRRLRSPLPLDTVRGYEGEAGKTYFSVFNSLIVAQKEDFCFERRSRRPPLDRVNCLLSLLYSLVAHDCVSALEGVGLDPAVGYLHRDRPGRPGLALDLMEEIRPVLADRLALSLINRQQVRAGNFRRTQSGAVLLDDDTRRSVLKSYHERKQEELQHPFLGEAVPLALVPHVQAMLLARHLRGDLDGYPPFFWK